MKPRIGENRFGGESVTYEGVGATKKWELIIECSMGVDLDAVCEQMGRTPPWAEALVLRADGYETMYYKKD